MKILTCYEKLFTKDSIIHNIGCLVILPITIFHIIIIFIFYIKHINELRNKISDIRSKIKNINLTKSKINRKSKNKNNNKKRENNKNKIENNMINSTNIDNIKGNKKKRNIKKIANKKKKK